MNFYSTSLRILFLWDAQKEAYVQSKCWMPKVRRDNLR